VHPDDIERYHTARAKALAEGDRLEYDFRAVGPDGKVRALQLRGRVVRRADGAAVEAYGVMLDITERKRAEDFQRRLTAECNHRMRNTLAKMGTIVELSRANATTINELTAAFNGRLNALARSHARMSRGTGKYATLRELVEDELAPHRSETNVSVKGPTCRSSPSPLKR
jgi:light-regulated signal transduction histidine kinase (bacteriophytochrome)